MKTRTHFQRAHVERKTFSDFVCMACHNFVSAETALSGVHNRNHCPYCLTSRHLDLFEAGDRLSACKARMRPVALSLKKTRKKYTGPNEGEVMIVHMCEGCGKVSINRIAADDDIGMLLDIFEESTKLDSFTRSLIALNDITILESGDHLILQVKLCGRN